MKALYFEQSEKVNDGMNNGGCLLCGKTLKDEHRIMLHLMPDGTFVDDKDDPIEVEPCAELGYWGIGSDCYRKFLRRAKDMTKDEIIANCI